MKRPRRLRIAVGSSLMSAGLVLAVAFVLFPLLTQPAVAAPAFVSPSWGTGFGSVSSGALTVATTAGNTVIVSVATKASTCTVAASGVTDNAAGGSSVYTQKVAKTGTGDWELWATAVGAAKAATSITVSLSGGPCKFAFSAAQYSGVTSFGNTNTASGSTANPTVSVTVQDNNGIAAGGFGTDTGTAPTAGTGNLRQAPCSTGGSSATRNCDSLIDNTQPTGGTSTAVSETKTAVGWEGGVIELRNQTPCTVAPTVTLGGGQTQISWSPATATEGPDMPTGETSGTPMVTLTNNGPGSCGLGISRQSGSPPSGVEDQWSATNSAPASGTNDITTSNAVVCAGVALGGTCQVWVFSRFTNAAPGTFTGTYVWTEA